MSGLTNALIAQIDGLWWPVADTDARGVLLNDVKTAVPALLKHVRARDCIVQAGGNVGVYPLALAPIFQRVLTFEPDPTNFQCLAKNIAARDSLGRVVALPAALGEARGAAGMHVVKASNCGAHRIDPGGSDVEVLALDELVLPRCDAIYLDVEGYELLALMGARYTIERFSPVLCVEDKGLHRAFGIEDGALQAWLSGLGYEQVDKIGNDKVWKRRAT
jgi:FkbM family methyltransferase